MWISNASRTNRGGKQGAVARLQDFEKKLADQAAQFGSVTHQLTVHALANPLEDFFRGFDPDVCADERVFQLFQKIGINLFFARKNVFDARDEFVARLLNAALQFFQ